MKVICRLGWVLLFAATGSGTFGHAAAAETQPTKAYPARVIRLIVPMSPGGFIDLTARLIAGRLSAGLGQQVIVDNRAGAGGVLGSEMAARADSDGHTLIIGSVGQFAVNQTLYPKLSYNVLRDFQPVARLAEAPSVLAVHPSFPVRTVKDLIELARSKPKQINYASAGKGTSTHLAAALFEHLAHVEFVHVPYKGGGPSIIAVVSGEVPMTFGTSASVAQHIKSGKLRALAVTGSQRSTQLPDLPTIAETGLPGYAMENWLGMFAPAGTPRTVIEKLSQEVLRVLRLPEVVAGLNAAGSEPSPLGPDAFAEFQKKEVEKWANVVKATGMTVN
jgi:tripartite-type tricarboxylate transporter receptor subunit TctC